MEQASFVFSESVKKNLTGTERVLFFFNDKNCPTNTRLLFFRLFDKYKKLQTNNSVAFDVLFFFRFCFFKYYLFPLTQNCCFLNFLSKTVKKKKHRNLLNFLEKSIQSKLQEKTRFTRHACLQM